MATHRFPKDFVWGVALMLSGAMVAFLVIKNGVEKMHVRTVTFRFDAIAECSLHSTLCCTTVAAPWRHQRQNHRLLTSRGRFDSATLAGETTTNDEDICCN